MLGQNEALHLKYFVAILVMALVVVLTIRLGDNQEATAYIGFAAGLASILLALVAIIHAFVTSERSSSVLAQIQQASDEIERAAQTISASASSLSTKIDVVPTHVGEVVRTETRSIIEALSKDISPADSAQDKAPNGAVMASYLVRMAFESGKPFRLTEVFEGTQELWFVVGALTAFKAVGKVQIESRSGASLRVKEVSNDILSLSAEKSIEAARAGGGDMIEGVFRSIKNWFANEHDGESAEPAGR